LAWRILLVWGRCRPRGHLLQAKMPESPGSRHSSGRADQARRNFTNSPMERSTRPLSPTTATSDGIRQFLANPRLLLMLVAPRLLVPLDYAYYGNTLSLPSILSEVSRMRASSETLLTLALFVIFALPGLRVSGVEDGQDRSSSTAVHCFGVMAVASFSRRRAALTTTSHLYRDLRVSYCSRSLDEHDDVRTSSEVFPSTCARRDTRGAGVGKLGAFVGGLGAPTRRHIGLRDCSTSPECRSTGLFAHQVLPRPPAITRRVSGEGDHLPTQEAAPAQVP